ncbi:cyclic nucleotide-binding domain-containing protein [Pendulispora albinea]|uniref:Patatin-like phospholipase domain-containing protein n=1 Tax=Pendulispora albinea TaxID=2741071 RepID=A0ABZ2LNT1_9BACT
MTCDVAKTTATFWEAVASSPEVDEWVRLEEIIGISPSFRALPKPHLEALARTARLERMASDRLVARDGERADRFVLILKGEVDAFWGEGLREVFRSLGRGDVFGAGLILGEPHVYSYGTRRDTAVAVWDDDALLRAELAAPGLRPELAIRLSKDKRLRELDELVQHAPLFRNSTSALRQRLLAEATLLRFAAGTFLYRQGEPSEYGYLVVRGEVELTQHVAAGGARERTVLLERGVSFGEMDLLAKTARTESAEATYETEVLAIARTDLEALRRACGSVRRALGTRANATQANATQANGTQANGVHAYGAPPLPQDCILVAGHVPYSMRQVAALLPDAFAARGEKRAALLEIAPEGHPLAARDGVLALPDDPTRALRALDERTQRLGARYCILYTQMERAIDWLARPSWDAIIAERISSSVYFTSDPRRSFPLETPKLAPAQYVELRPQHRAGETNMVRDGAMRLLVDPAHGADLRYGALPSEGRRALQRLTRTIARQSVGLALGGGSAWCYAHVALLRAFHEEGIPIDILAGISVGSMVACAYASRGLEGLDNLVALRRESAFCFAFFPVTRRPLARFIAKNLLEHRYLQDMPLRVVTVATDIQTGRARIFRHGPAIDAMFASTACPAVFPPHILADGVRCVDGGVANNVPVNALVREGADFIVASNVIPSPCQLARETHAREATRIFSQLSPIRRAQDGFRAMLFMMREAGTRESRGAHITFNPSLEKFGIADYLEADKIVEHVRPELPPFIAQVKERYQAFCRSSHA